MEAHPRTPVKHEAEGSKKGSVPTKRQSIVRMSAEQRGGVLHAS